MGFKKKFNKFFGLKKDKPQVINPVPIQKQDDKSNNEDEIINEVIAKSKEDIIELDYVNNYHDEYSLLENLSIIESNYHTKKIEKLDEPLDKNKFYNINEIVDDDYHEAYNDEIENNSKNYPSYEVYADELWITKPVEHIIKNKNYDKMLGNLEKTKINIDEIKFIKDNNGNRILLGKGRYGSVYLGEIWSCNLAVKKIESNNKNHETILNELIITNNMFHPNLINLVAWAKDEESYYIVTEYIEGGDLYELLKTKSINLKEKISIIKMIASAMLYLHSYKPPIIHRDIKSLNILVTKSKDKAYVIDYGIAKQLTTTYIKKTSDISGSLPWMDPNLFNNVKYNIKSDVYSFGILLYEILSDTIPYSNYNFLDTQVLQDKVKEGVRPDLSLIIKNTPEKLIELMKRCWDGNKDNRPCFREICDTLRLI